MHYDARQAPNLSQGRQAIVVNRFRISLVTTAICAVLIVADLSPLSLCFGILGFVGGLFVIRRHLVRNAVCAYHREHPEDVAS